MAGESDWRKSWGYLVNSDEDDRRTSTTTEPPSSVTYEEHSSDDDSSTFSSLVSEEVLIHDDEVHKRISRLLQRDRRSRHHKKAKDRDSHHGKNKNSGQIGQHKSNHSYRHSREHFVVGEKFLLSDTQDVSENEIKDVEIIKCKHTMEKVQDTKRVVDALDRDVTDGSDSPKLPCQVSVSVDTRNHFKSLNSKQVIPKGLQSSGVLTPVKPQSQECPQDRQDFWMLFSLLVRMGNPDRKSKEDRDFTRQRSHEDHIWQNKLNDLIWLSLRAWHSGRSIREEDYVLCNERVRIKSVLDEVMNFQFRPSSDHVLTAPKGCVFLGPLQQTGYGGDTEDGTAEQLPSVEVDPAGSNSLLQLTKGSRRLPKLEIPAPSGNFSVSVDGVELPTFNPGYSCCGLCCIFCQTCLANQNEALTQVKDLLDRLDEVERLYPSSRAMQKEWTLYQSKEFTGRVKSLCLFYNLVTDLRHKISTLGKMQASFGQKNVPWPSFVPLRHCPVEVGANVPSSSSSSVDSAAAAPDPNSGCSNVPLPSSPTPLEIRERKSSKCVRFAGGDKHSGLSVKLDAAASGGGSNSSDSGYGPSSLTPTSSSPANEAASPGLSPAPENVCAWTWTTAASSTLAGSATSTSPNASIYSRSVSDQSSGDVPCVTPYRRYVDRLLKTKGLRKIFAGLMDLIRNTLVRARYALECRPGQQTVTSPELPRLGADEQRFLSKTKPPFCNYLDCCDELREFGLWGEHFQKMTLPSFRSLYLFLIQIPLDVMHECLQLQLEQQPRDPSSLSVRQLMRECKEAIKAAVVIRQKFLRMTRTLLLKPELDHSEHDMVEFDANVERMLQSYLNYFQSWVQMVLKSMQQTQKNVLEDEWTFVKVFSRYVQRGEALACETFCSLACSMFESTGDNLDAGLDRCTSLLYDSISSEHDLLSSRQSIGQVCRDYKDAFQEARKRALKAISFAKMLRKDLEIAAEFRIEGCTGELLKKLKETDHVRLVAPHSSSIIIFIPSHIQNNRLYLWQLLSMTYGHEHSAAPDNADSEGYLVILSCKNCGLVPGPWSGPMIVIEPTAEITITLSHLNVEGLLLVVNHSSQLGAQRKAFQKAMGPIVTLTKEFTSCNQSIADSLGDMKREAVNLQCKITRAIQDVEDRLNLDSVSDLDEANLQSRFREVLHQCYKFGFEYQKEVTRLVTGESRCELGHGLISFANQWMQFVLKRCERGRGVRPRWANQGLDFLMTACEPQYLKSISDEQFQCFKQTMNDCIAHLIGSADNKGTSTTGGIGSRSHSPTPHRPNFKQSASYSETGSRMHRTISSVSVKSEPPMPSYSSSNLLSPWSPEELKSRTETEDDLDDVTSTYLELPMSRIQRAIAKLDCKREKKLRSNNMIGRVRDVSVETTIHINARRVTFRWQRGNKIGQGRFGKVYTAVNTDTGELMALKEIHLQPNDHKTIKEVADELRIFEGIKHPHLVRYYGVEIHREEMFIFMEYCDYGTLEHAAQLGLLEPQVRKYTRQLLEAVCILHEHGIVHRDIKGANVFLTSDGNLKLGDFGCCIKLKNHTTMPGELNSFVGTQAFMAPEVFTKSVTEGHGRAADVWSVGCVVLEMTTGHRPWHELENNYQIMFKVGMGEMPEIPDMLSQEGHDFLSHCFKFDPRERWTAVSLLDHPFTKVDSDDDFQSITFLPDAHLLLQKLAVA